MPRSPPASPLESGGGPSSLGSRVALVFACFGSVSGKKQEGSGHFSPRSSRQKNISSFSFISISSHSLLLRRFFGGDFPFFWFRLGVAGAGEEGGKFGMALGSGCSPADEAPPPLLSDKSFSCFLNLCLRSSSVSTQEGFRPFWRHL